MSWTRIDEYRDKVNDGIFRLELSKKQTKNLQAKLTNVENNISELAEARSVVNEVAEQLQQQLSYNVEMLVTRCLQDVFCGKYGFRILWEQSRGKTECYLKLLRGENEIDPLDSDSIGVADVASFALRLASLQLQKPAVRKILILDEPFKFVSKSYRDAVAQLITDLAEELGIQFIIVTHMEELEIGKVVQLGK